MSGRSLFRAAAAALFVAAGANHFIDPAFYDAMIPPQLPTRRFWTLLTGAAEVFGGVGLLVPALRRAAGRGLAVMLVGFLWVHIGMLIQPAAYGAEDVPAWALWVRLALQPVLVWWVLRVSRADG